MTYEERKQQVCKDCPINRLSCSYRNRDLENKCLDLQTIMGGWELGQEDTLKSLWKDAQGDDLPEIDREVVAFQTITNDELFEMEGASRVVIAHRPDPKGWNARNLSTGEVEHYTPKTYDKGGWNMEGVTWWLDAPLPKGLED